LIFLTRWLMKNVGVEFSKPLRMQKLLVIEMLAMKRYNSVNR
jgi:hypothetical protein